MMHFSRGIKLNMIEKNKFNSFVIMELIEWLQKIRILNIFILKSQVLLGFEITDIISFECEQANSENCGPPCGNKFDLEKGQRSRSQHGAIWKGLSQGSCMPNINALPLILKKIWARLKFFVTDRRTEKRTDGRMSFNVPPLSLKRGDKKSISSIFDDRYIKNGLSSSQCFSINTKLSQVAFSKRNMEGSNSKRFEKMNMQNALCGTFWL